MAMKHSQGHNKPTPEMQQFIKDLYRDMGQACEVDLEALSYTEADRLIKELKQMRAEYREKMEGKDDGKYWY